MITTPVRDDIRAFAAAVRTHLDDLPADEVDDLLDGLEADLSDQAAEAGEHFEIPDAATYAAELRSAAGLPERGAPRTAPKREPLLEQVKDGWREVGEVIRKNPVGAWLLDLFGALRPVWWLVRGATWYVCLYLFVWIVVPSSVSGGLLGAILALGGNPVAWAILLAALTLSVQWGRGRWLPGKGVRVLRSVLTVGAVFALPILAGLFAQGLSLAIERANAVPEPYQISGLSVDGQRVRNIFAFDVEGNPIPVVQLFDQNGAPLTTVGADSGPQTIDGYFYGGGGPVPVPYPVPGGNGAWNIFPLRELPAGSWMTPDDIANAGPTEFPFSRVQPLPADVVRSATEADTTPVPTPTPLADAEHLPDASAP
ncbi:hypothetical protein [uncultured Microbacterium sp.]|uniref:hypothetical protein n=1 Tax=uncultured Microbacterium sp. TaxID=191216 RepID=UPI0025DD7084|nr:hypothetical protein [uncultured Microbacterium sp.]